MLAWHRNTPITPLKMGIRIVISLNINKKKKIKGLEKLTICIRFIAPPIESSRTFGKPTDEEGGED
jgi:hypothetical protein